MNRPLSPEQLMPVKLNFELDGREVEAFEGESIFDAAKRHGTELPHLCHNDPLRPELMPRTPEQALQPALLQRATVVCGCGGGQAVRGVLPAVLQRAGTLVLDADALNALDAEGSLQQVLKARAARQHTTVLTPHPLEAARLLRQG